MSDEAPIHQNKEWLWEQYVDRGLKLREMAEIANRTVPVIHYWMKKHGIPRRRPGANSPDEWSDEENAIIERLWSDPHHTNKTIADLLPGRTPIAVKGHASFLGLKGNLCSRHNWTKQEEEIVRQYYPNPFYHLDDIDEMLPEKTKRSIRWKAKYLGLGAGFMTGKRANIHRLFINYRKSAKARSHAFELTELELADITSQNCHYCGAPPSREIDAYDEDHPYAYNGIDRIDNGKGYTSDNVVPCCLTCNRAKNQKSYDEFRSWARALYRHWGRREEKDT